VIVLNIRVIGWVAPGRQEAQALDGKPLDVFPRLRDYKAPEYPPLPLAAGIEGIVVIEVVIDLKGGVNYAKVVTSNVSPVMNRAALAAGRKSLFEPGKRNDKPVESKLEIPIHFNLR